MTHSTFTLVLSFCLITNAFSQFSFPEIPGNTKEVSEDIYTPENLWDLINGAADAYLENDFAKLYRCGYEDSSENLIRVDVYEHDSREGALGIYANERNTDYRFLPIGAEGYITGDALNLFVGKYYIKCRGNDPSVLQKVAEKVSTSLNIEGGYPEAFNVFPDHESANTRRFINTNFLGYSFLQDFYLANYNQDAVFFLTKRNTSKEVQKLLNLIAEKSGVQGQKHSNITQIEDRYSGTLFVEVINNYLIGAKGATKEDAIELLNACKSKLKEN